MDSPIAPITKSFPDLGFLVVAQPSEYLVDYKIYDVIGYDTADNEFVYERAGATDSMDTTKDLAEAQIFIQGHIKWDGCSNWSFDVQDECMLHCCDRHDLERIGLILATCWDWTAELCGKWNPI